MITGLIDSILTKLKADIRLQNNTGTHTLVNSFTETVDDEPVSLPAISFISSSNVRSESQTISKSRFLTYSISLVIFEEEYETVWKSYKKLDAIALNVMNIILEDPHLGSSSVIDSSITGIDYSAVLDAGGNPYRRVLFLTLEIKTKVTIQ